MIIELHLVQRAIDLFIFVIMVNVSRVIHCFLFITWGWAHQLIIFLFLLLLLIYFYLKHSLCIESQIFNFNRILLRVELKLSNDWQDTPRVLDIFFTLEAHALYLCKVWPNRHRTSLWKLGICQCHYESDWVSHVKNVKKNIPVKLLNNWCACILQPSNISKHETISRILLKMWDKRLRNSLTMTYLKLPIRRSNILISHFNFLLRFLNILSTFLDHPRNRLPF